MKTLAVITYLLVHSCASAQLAVDSVKTEEDIEAFVKQYGEQHWPYWKTNFYMQSDNSYRAESDGKPDSLRYVKWYIEDFNKDGKKDLIFSNINNYSSNSKFFSLTSNAKGKYEYFNLLRYIHNHLTFNFELSKHDSSALLYLSENRFSNRNTPTLIHYVKEDTLVAAVGGFVEKPNRVNKQVKFDTLEFWYSPNLTFMWAASIPHDMHITIVSKNNMIKYQEYGCTNEPTEYELERGISEDLNVENTFRSEDIVKRVKEMLSFSNMKKAYFLDSLIDHPDRITIKIKMEKKEVNIIDDGMQSNYWVNLFCKKMFAISQKVRGDITRYFLKNPDFGF